MKPRDGLYRRRNHGVTPRPRQRGLCKRLGKHRATSRGQVTYEASAQSMNKVVAPAGRLGAERGQGHTGELYPAYIGKDVYKDTIAVRVAECGRGEPADYGLIANAPGQTTRLIDRISARYEGRACALGPIGIALQAFVPQQVFGADAARS